VRLVFVSLCAVLLVLGAACGLDVVGSLDATVVSQPDASEASRAALPDAELPDDSGVEAAPLAQIPIGPEPETPIPDAGADVVVGDCGSPIIADNFNSGVGPRWLTYGEATPGNDGFGNGFVRMIPGGQGSKVAGLFTRPGFTATSFTASFRYLAQTPAFSDGNVGDGITFFWITSGAVSQATLADAISGGGLGIPRTLGGYAFALDAYRNSNIADPSSPSFSLLHVEPAKGSPGAYDWHIQNDGPYSGVYDVWRTVTITYAGGKLSASVSGTQLFKNVNIPPANILYLGFTAATGGVGALGWAVDTVNIELTDPVCP
jgi:hypothetical protein